MVANVDPFSLGTVQAYFDQTFSSAPKVADVEVIFYPRLNAAALQFKYEFVTYRQFWNEANRRQFIGAFERYKTDFAEKNLINRARKTRAIYGKVNGQLEWESFRIARTRTSYPSIEVGYRFKRKPRTDAKMENQESPFFSTLMRAAQETETTGDDPTKSQQISMYFTLAQAEELVALFDQAHILALIQEFQTGPAKQEATSSDEYYEM